LEKRNTVDFHLFHWTRSHELAILRFTNSIC